MTAPADIARGDSLDHHWQVLQTAAPTVDALRTSCRYLIAHARDHRARFAREVLENLDGSQASDGCAP